MPRKTDGIEFEYYPLPTKTAIKREQGQTCLNSAERENPRTNYKVISTDKALAAIGMKKIIIAFVALLLTVAVNAQTGLKKVYNDDINPIEQIDQAVVKAKSEGKFVICQVGGNWCPWCLRFADFITNDTTISKVISENFEYIHVSYNPRKSQGAEKLEQGKALMKRLNNAGRFGFPVLVVLDEEGRVIHIQDSSLLEEGKGYNQKKVLGFFKGWTPKAVKN
jgi:thioredoxin-related protein